MTLSVLTLNVALLQVSIFGIPLFSFTPYASARMLHIISQIADSGADVVCLQELSGSHAKNIINGLSNVYPYSLRDISGKIFSSDIVLLSKYPFSSTAYHRFSHHTWFERIVMNKGVVGGTITVGDNDIHIACTHLVANGFPLGADKPAVNHIRGEEVDEIISYTKNHPNMILVGDFNTGPEADRGNYEKLTQHFVDTFSVLNPETASDADSMTWDTENPLVQQVIDLKYPSQRVDTLFINQYSRLKPVASKLMFRDYRFMVGEGESKTPMSLSDHWGVMTTFSIQ
jgi:endonuclease/exonuclease/phosphatase family metal-dependent hydrolase